MKLSIVLGITEYQGSISDLPACKNDAEAMAVALGKEAGFDDSLVLNACKGAAETKRLITDFVRKHRDKSIDQIVFYYTGHGDFSEGEFYYLLSDYDRKRPKQTTLENGEVDSLLRSLKPALAVKIIDACHSGITYIKDPGQFDEFLKGTGNTFANCYFLFSSLADQSSYQDRSLSFFTRSVIKAIRTHENAQIRYKDVIDFVCDDFDGDAKQQPFFVVQADYTDVLCTVTDNLRNGLSRFDTASGGPIVSANDAKSIKEAVVAAAAKYSSEKETVAVVEELVEQMRQSQPEEMVAELYNMNVFTNGSIEIDQATIGKWLSQNPNELFAEAREVRRKVRKALSSSERKSVTYGHRIETVVTGYKSTVELPFEVLQTVMNPKYPNLTAYRCYVVPLVSRTAVRLFHATCKYANAGWDSYKITNDPQWATFEFDTRKPNGAAEAVAHILSLLWHGIEKDVREEFASAGTNTDAAATDERKDLGSEGISEAESE